MLPVHAGRYASEDWPFRGRPPGPAPDEMPRVLFLGDSCVFGTGVDTSQTLSHQAALELARLGHGPERVQLLNLGVPGYSLVQVRELLREALADLAPVAAVFYVGAWNDQAPASQLDDLALLARWRAWLRRSALASFLSGSAGAAPGPPPPAADGPPRPRVPEGAFAELLAEVVSSCRTAGAWPLVVAPAHPESTAIDHPRTRRDAATCLRVAAELEVAALDAQSILESGLPPESRFLDFIHPAPPALALLAGHVARALAPRIEERAPPPDPAFAGELRFEPACATTFGDVPVVVRSVGFEFPLPPFTLIAGGAPVLDLVRVSAHECRGLLPANGPGDHEVVLQGPAGVGVFPAAVAYALPELRIVDGRLLASCASGARAVVGGSRRLAPAPRYSPQGRSELDPSSAWKQTLTLVCDGEGRAELDLARAFGELGSSGYLQGIFTPASVPDELHLGRWSSVAALEGPRR
jgi:lysophospholipase L1-like esterase